MECKWEGNSYKTNDGRHQAVKTFLIVLTVKFFTLFLPCMATSRVGTAKWPQDNLGKFRSKLHGDDPPRIRGQQVMMDPLDPEDGISEAGNGCWDKSWTWPVSSPSSSSSSLSSSSSSPSSSSESSSISSRYSSWSPSSSSNPSWKVKLSFVHLQKGTRNNTIYVLLCNCSNDNRRSTKRVSKWQKSPEPQWSLSTKGLMTRARAWSRVRDREIPLLQMLDSPRP